MVDSSEISGSAHFLFVVGTRPEIIKMGPVIRDAVDHEDIRSTLVHTNQHFDEEMSDVFFDTLDLPEPDMNLGVGSGTQAEQTADGMVGIDRCIESADPDVVLAQGDTNTVLSAALATSKREALFAHVEAGIRCGDHSMPEEVNRRLADDIADLRFAPTETAEENLRQEGFEDGVHVTGNTVVDACHEHVDIAGTETNVHDRLGLNHDSYVVATVHRPRNTDDEARLTRLLNALDDVPYPVVFPAHPRTSARIDAWDGDLDGSLKLVQPLDYLAFLDLLRNARAVVTDSGGVQEEASILEVPCLTVRPNTERPETVTAGVNELVTPSTVGDRLTALLTDESRRDAMTGHPGLYGDGNASSRIVSTCLETVDDSVPPQLAAEGE